MSGRDLGLWLVRFALAALFLFAGVAKLADPIAFAVEITNYRLASALAPWLAATLPAIEIAVGAALVAPWSAWRRAGALAATGLLLVFTIAVTQTVVRGINVDCGCFGGQSGPVTGLTIARDLALLAACLLLLLAAPRSAATPPVVGR